MSDGIEVLVEQNTPEWHAFRRTGGPGNPYPAALGASDVGILMGGTREERERLFMEKCGALVEQEPTLQMQQGHDAEPFIREQYMERIEVAGRPATLYSPDFPFLFASCDFLSDSAEVIAEFKRMAAARHERLREVGPEPRVYWQCMAQLNVVRQARSCHLVGALFMDIADLALVVILPDEEEFLRIIAMATRFLTGVREGDRAYALGDSETLAGAPGGEGTVEPPAPGPIAPPGAAWRQPGPLFPSPEDVKAAGGGEFEQRLAAPLGLEAAFKGKAITPADMVAEAERMARSIVARFTPQRDAMLARFTAIEITDGATADEASAMFGQATKIEGQVGDELTRMRKHFTNAADAISAVVKPFIAPIADAKPKLKVKLNAYIERVNAERDARDREAAKLAADLRAKGHTDAVVTARVDAAMIEQPVAPMPTGVASWREPVVVAMDWETLPRQFMKPDESGIKKSVKEAWRAAKESGSTEDAFIARIAQTMPGVTVEFQRRTQSS